jgi:S-DNA-T family DNA segregation ATPase FtsK/SpoIIIE
MAPVNVTEPARVALGVAGDGADPIAVDLLHGDGRWLVAGPARSGRTTVLVSILRQLIAAPIEVLVAAPTRSPLSTAAADLGLTALNPTSARLDESFTRSRGPRVVLIDDSAAFADQPIEAQLLDLMASAGSGGLGVVAGARADDVSISYRGIAAAIRRSGTGILLQPGPAEGELLGVRLPRRRSALPPGRGVLVCDQADAIELQRGRAALPIQLAQ